MRQCNFGCRWERKFKYWQYISIYYKWYDKTKKGVYMSLITIGDADKLLGPYLKHSEYRDFVNSNNELKKLQEKIKKWTTNNKPSGLEAMFRHHQELDDEVREMFQKYYEICEDHFKLKQT